MIFESIRHQAVCGHMNSFLTINTWAGITNCHMKQFNCGILENTCLYMFKLIYPILNYIKLNGEEVLKY